MKLDGVGIMINDLKKSAEFYKNVLGFEIELKEGDENVYIVKNGVVFMLYGRKNLEKMTGNAFNYAQGINGHFEIALSVDSFAEVDKTYEKAVISGAKAVMPPTTEPWGQRTCYIADIEGNLIEIGSFNK